MDKPQPIRIKAEHRSHPNLRKLARALISLARRELEEEVGEDKPQPPREREP